MGFNSAFKGLSKGILHVSYEREHRRNLKVTTWKT